MNLNTTSATMNSSTALLIPTSQTVTNLGWSAMPTFPDVVVEKEISLGWGAMPAFGESAPTCNDAESVADFARETHQATPKADLVKSFWRAMSLRA